MVKKESDCNVGNQGLIPGSGKSPGEGNGNPLWYYCQDNPWTEEPGRLQPRGVTKSLIQLSKFKRERDPMYVTLYRK